MKYKTLEFFDLFSTANKLDCFLFGDWIVITRKRFFMLPSCTFRALNAEWKHDATSHTVTKIGN